MRQHFFKENMLVPWGIFGAGNIGDDAVLQGFGRLTNSYLDKNRIWIASRNPSHTKVVEPRFNYYNSTSRFLSRPRY